MRIQPSNGLRWFAGITIAVLGLTAFGYQLVEPRLSAQQATRTTSKAGPPNRVGKSSPESEVRAALDDAIRRLDEGDYRGFIENYLPIDELRRRRTENAVGSLAATMKEKPELIKPLRDQLIASRKAMVRLDESQCVVTFVGIVDSEPVRYIEPWMTQVAISGYAGDWQQALAQGIQSLERGNVEEFILRMFPVGELRRPQADKLRAALIARLASEPACLSQMLQDLRFMLDLEPTFEKAGNVAVFRLSGSRRRYLGLPDQIVKLQKVESDWRFYDHTTTARKLIAQQSALPLPDIEGSGKLTWEKLGDHWRLASLVLHSL